MTSVTETFKTKQTRQLLWTFFWVTAFQAVAMASTTGLPWETPMGMLAKSLTGPIALGIALVMIVVVGGGMMARPDVFEFGSKAVMIPLILAVLLAASGLITTFFPGLVGAVV